MDRSQRRCLCAGPRGARTSPAADTGPGPTLGVRPAPVPCLGGPGPGPLVSLGLLLPWAVTTRLRLVPFPLYRPVSSHCAFLEAVKWISAGVCGGSVLGSVEDARNAKDPTSELVSAQASGMRTLRRSRSVVIAGGFSLCLLRGSHLIVLCDSRKWIETSL